MTGPHSPGNILRERYSVVEYVAKGGMQFVYSAHDRLLEREVALKTPQNEAAARRFKSSAVVAARINHRNVAKTLDFFVEDGREYLVEEFVDGFDLSSAIIDRYGCGDPYLVARVLHHLSKGLLASHRAKVIHRDLKPSNVLVGKDDELSCIKITDFGIAKLAEEEFASAAEDGDMTNSNSSTVRGALPYMSPEAIMEPRKVTQATDVWSLGAMVYELLTGAKPFGAGLPAVAKILERKILDVPAFVTRNPQFASLAGELVEICLSCMSLDPSARPTCEDLIKRSEQLCYSIAPRYRGVVRKIKFKSWGFIRSDGEDVFFNQDSVFGPENVGINDEVSFAKFPGGGAWRAHPMVRIK